MIPRKFSLMKHKSNKKKRDMNSKIKNPSDHTVRAQYSKPRSAEERL